jgi:hypothetical protein
VAFKAASSLGAQQLASKSLIDFRSAVVSRPKRA